MIYVRTPRWKGWIFYQLPGPRFEYRPGIGACLERQVGGGRLWIGWGPAAQHTQAEQWRTTRSTDWYVDMEWINRSLPTCPLGGTAAHIERRFKTREEAEGSALWLRSCVEVAGEEGLLALNARTGGRLA